MDDLEIQNIWNENKGLHDSGVRYSISDIKKFREERSRQSSDSTGRLIIFDSGYKTLIAMGFLAQLFLGQPSFLKLGISVVAISFLAFLIVNNQTLKIQLNRIDESMDVTNVLKHKFKFLSRFYREFLFITSISHPLFILVGFQFYQFFKYGEDRLMTLLLDPVTYLFLTLGFIIPLGAQRIGYQQQLHELDEIMDSGLDEVNADIKMIKMRAQKRTRIIVFSILLLAGLLALLVLVNSIM